jgi:hypothetical protein
MWIVLGSYIGKRVEVIDVAANEIEAQRLLNEYRIAFSSTWSLWTEPK